MKRLNDADGKSDKNATSNNKHTGVREQNKYSKGAKPKGPPNKMKPFGQKPFSQKARGPPQSRGPPIKKENKKKVKKPKHLKRKLEQLGEDNAEAREDILKKMGDLETAKENHSSQKKRPKKENLDSGMKDNPETSTTKENLSSQKQRPKKEMNQDSEMKDGTETSTSKENLTSQIFSKKEKNLDSEMKDDTETSTSKENLTSQIFSKKEKNQDSDMKDDPETSKSKENLTSQIFSKNQDSGMKNDPETSTSKENLSSQKQRPKKEMNLDSEVKDAAETSTSKEKELSSESKPSDITVAASTQESGDKTSEGKPSKPETESHDDSDSDSDEDVLAQRRQRGRRRRGRKDTAEQIKELDDAENQADGKTGIMKEGGEKMDGDEDKKDNKRYCVGRKALTDFKIGQSYTGKVVYMKSFGIFIDIGCHSDAFCHVSRLSDDYVESPEAFFKEGDEVNPRVVEIDRRRKKITVSLQSEARIADERASVEARNQRKVVIKPKPPASKKPKVTHSEADEREHTDKLPWQQEAKQEIQREEIPPPQPSRKTEVLPPDEFTMNPAELKRARKLQRRAARREQGDATQ
jgi:predicted RNA-binding protein with RPS1 domain